MKAPENTPLKNPSARDVEYQIPAISQFYDVLRETYGERPQSIETDYDENGQLVFILYSFGKKTEEKQESDYFKYTLWVNLGQKKITRFAREKKSLSANEGYQPISAPDCQLTPIQKTEKKINEDIGDLLSTSHSTADDNTADGSDNV